MAHSVTNSSHFGKIPTALLKEIGGSWLSGEDLARLITTCRFIKSTFSSVAHRFPIAVYNGLGIGRHINSEVITTLAFQAKIVQMRDTLAPHVVTIVRRNCLVLLGVALSSKKMTIGSRGPAVMEAASRGHLLTLNLLLANGEISYEDRGLALIEAARGGHPSSIKALLASGPIEDKVRGTAVYNAAIKGHLFSIQALLTGGPISNSHRGLAIDLATRGGHFDCIRALLRGLMTRSTWLDLRIDAAREAGKASIVAYLEAWQPHIFEQVPGDVLTEIGRSLLTVRELARFVGTCSFMRDTFSSGTHRFQVDAYNSLRIERSINSEEITVRDFQAKIKKMRDTLAPHVVTIVGRECYRLLRIALSSKKMTVQLRGCALGRAAYRGPLFALDMILESGRISVEDMGMALRGAAEKGHPSSIRALLAIGLAEIDRGIAVYNAASNGHLSSIQALLARRGPIFDHCANSALYAAARGGHLDCVKELLKGSKARPTWLDDIINGAQKAGKLDIVAFLEKWKPEEEKD